MSTRNHSGLDSVQGLVLPKRYESSFLIVTDLLIICLPGGMGAGRYQALILQMSKWRLRHDQMYPRTAQSGFESQGCHLTANLGKVKLLRHQVTVVTTCLTEFTHVKASAQDARGYVNGRRATGTDSERRRENFEYILFIF